MGWGLRGSFKREVTQVYLWLIHVDVWQKPTQHYKAIILQLKINKLKKKTESELLVGNKELKLCGSHGSCSKGFKEEEGTASKQHIRQQV